MGNIIRAFRPLDRATKALTASTTVQRETLMPSGAQLTSRHLRIHNAGSSLAFVRFGDKNVVASATAVDAIGDIPLPAGLTEILSAPPDTTHVSYITASGTASLYITPGEGA